MPSEGNSIFNTLFGCCLGRRSNSSFGNDEHGGLGHDGADERTPLIGGRASNGKDVAAEIGSGTVNSQGQGTTLATLKEQAIDKRARSKKRNADVARLRAIRDQANDAFFYIDNSQLLPSSSSSRPINSSGSQMFGGSTWKKDQRRDATLHQELVNESDKAERLYRAALASSASVGGSDELAFSPQEREAPLSLVRQMKVTIREAAAATATTNSSNQDTSIDDVNLIPPLNHPASSQHLEAHAKMGMDVDDQKTTTSRHHLSINKIPSSHSLRTLRLSNTQSPDSPSIDSNSPLERTPNLEEDWSRRGRTRGKRGLAWIDCGPSENLQQAKPRLQEVFSEHKEANQGAAEAEKAAEEEVPNALRLSSKQTDAASDVQERLKSVPAIAEIWDPNQDR